MVRNLGEGNSIFNQFIREIRDQEIQKDRLRFRRNLERIGEIMAYEISKELEYENCEVVSPLGSAHMDLPVSYPILATILRAGLPLHQGLMNIFDHSGSAYVSAFRKHDKDGGFEIAMGYASSPGLTDETLVISDPMLATGSSMVLTYKEMMNFGIPKHTHIVCAIASTEGIDYVNKYLPMDKVSLWVGAIDEELTAQSYIVPGLGDAGDLAFGPKI